MGEIERIIEGISDLDSKSMWEAQKRQNELTKPPGSLGVLEQISIRLAGMQGTSRPEIGKKVVIVMAADHGITEEGVSAFPADVTAQMVYNFTEGGAAVNVLARQAEAEVIAVDIGVKEDIKARGVIQKKIRPGTANMARGPAMTLAQAREAVLVGSRVAGDAIEESASVIATGDMGIGNTSASSAIISSLGDIELEAVVGRGTGVDDEGLKKKVATIELALELNEPDKNDPFDVLHKVGGLEIAGLVGVILECARRRTPVIIDGFISSAAALVASKLAPKSINYMIASHMSAETGHSRALAEIGLSPMLNMNMRLGEGTGAVLALTVIEAAAKLLTEMATFEQAGVSREKREEASPAKSG
ncbi:MAG TPA: nicotinate-nucleotide--dimethylbenzimidazole phosphoribosyltransferase [Actinobacteria bacterium]|nr:nicotinate-nucleotide--dimethylbenzimidazole phosphoribosyltransferase [Actinomycetota bacterium]